jgi:hypothetical protein
MTVRLTVLVLFGVVASWRRASGQGGGWIVTPTAPTVGDTVWIEREVAVPAGWQVRAGKLVVTDVLEPLTEPAVLRSPAGWVVRYAVVAWKPGAQRVTMPPIWRLARDGRADSLPGGMTGFTVASVIPEGVKSPDPRGPLAPLRTAHRGPLAPLAGLVATTLVLVVGVALRRRPPRSSGPTGRALQVPVEREGPDARWLAAGEPKAVAARATWRVRSALVRAVPEAHPALATAECLAVVERARPGGAIRELRDVLEQLDRVAYGSAQGTDVPALAALALRLAKQLTP